MGKVRERRHKARTSPYPATAKKKIILQTAQKVLGACFHYSKKLLTQVILPSFNWLSTTINRAVDNYKKNYYSNEYNNHNSLNEFYDQDEENFSEGNRTITNNYIMRQRQNDFEYLQQLTTNENNSFNAVNNLINNYQREQTIINYNNRNLVNFNNLKTRQKERRILNYTEIDNRALNTPSQVETNLTLLSQYLTLPYTTVEEKSRSIFRWITNNIAYDVIAYNSKDYRYCSAEDVLIRRKGVCAGYANLFDKLCLLSGISNHKISGTTKRTQSFNESSHAWNAVQTEDGFWHLIDSTWASGYVSNTFVKRFEDRYFFISPKELIYSHFPKEEHWQLLEKPVSREEFKKTAEIRASAFHYNFCALSHQLQNYNLTSSAHDTIYVSVDIGCSLAVNVKKKGSLYEKYENSYHVTEIELGKFEIRLLFPENNTFEVLIFTEKGKESTHCITYNYIISPSASIFKYGFPKKFKGYHDHKVMILSGFDGKIILGDEYNFAFKVEGASEVGFRIGDHYVPFQKRGNVFSLNYKFAKYGNYSSRELMICTVKRYSTMNHTRYSYNGLLEYKLI
ncbi:hypothetical protein ABK040_000204 [Willaertia magna]